MYYCTGSITISPSFKQKTKGSLISGYVTNNGVQLELAISQLQVYVALVIYERLSIFLTSEKVEKMRKLY